LRKKYGFLGGSGEKYRDSGETGISPPELAIFVVFFRFCVRFRFRAYAFFQNLTKITDILNSPDFGYFY
jgi:hypothetical protein